jgi:hypothetical protein
MNDTPLAYFHQGFDFQRRKERGLSTGIQKANRQPVLMPIIVFVDCLLKAVLCCGAATRSSVIDVFYLV